jgi:hypothetical protein
MHIIWVSAVDGDDITGDGSRYHAYKTIEKALTVFTNQDQIRILDGTYTPVDSIVITGLEGSIFAENPLGVFIQPQKTRLHAACVAIIDAPRFSLIGFNVLQAADTSGNLIGIYAENVENFLCYTCTVSNFEIPSGTAKGIYASGTGRIENCQVFNFAGAGAFVYGIHGMGIEPIDCEVFNLSGMNETVGILFDGLNT